MTEEEVNLHQQIMDAAYGRIDKDKRFSKDEFHDSLSAQERFAVHLGNFNYQVENGGFMQWWDNRYGTPEVVEFLLRACERIGTPTAEKVATMIKQFKSLTGGIDPHGGNNMDEEDWDELADKLGDLDSPYYAINEQFMVDCNEHLKAGKF